MAPKTFFQLWPMWLFVCNSTLQSCFVAFATFGATATQDGRYGKPLEKPTAQQYTINITSMYVGRVVISVCAKSTLQMFVSSGMQMECAVECQHIASAMWQYESPVRGSWLGMCFCSLEKR